MKKWIVQQKRDKWITDNIVTIQRKKISLKVIKLWYKYVFGLAYRFLEKMAEFVFK